MCAYVSSMSLSYVKRFFVYKYGDRGYFISTVRAHMCTHMCTHICKGAEIGFRERELVEFSHAYLRCFLAYSLVFYLPRSKCDVFRFPINQTLCFCRVFFLDMQDSLTSVFFRKLLFYLYNLIKNRGFARGYFKYRFWSQPLLLHYEMILNEMIAIVSFWKTQKNSKRWGSNGNAISK